MKNLKIFLSRRVFLLFFLLFYIAISAFTYRDYGTTIDEFNVYMRGKLFYEKVRGNDQILQKDFVIPQDQSTLTMYNNTQNAFYYAINGSENYETYHLLNLIFGSFIFIAIYELILLYSKKPYFALLGSVFLFLTPRFFGDIPANPKDIPFAIWYFLSLTGIVLLQKSEEKLRILILGFIFGMTQGLRLVGYSIYFVYLFALLLRIDKKKPLLNQLKNLALEGFIIAIIGYFVHMATMPFLGADPFNNFISLLNMTKQFGWISEVLLWGRTHMSTSLPWYYLPSWILVTTPIFILITSIYGLMFGNKKHLSYQITTAALVVNLAIFFITRPIIYDGLRHMLFLLPMVVVLSSIGVFEFFHRKFSFTVKIAVMALLIVNILGILVSYVRLHPYEYVYFNEIVGGLPGARGNFETDYWGAANKEAALWLGEYFRSNGTPKKLKIYVCSYRNHIVDYLGTDAQAVDKKLKDSADFTICWERNEDHLTIKGKKIHTVFRMDTPLVYVFKND